MTPIRVPSILMLLLGLTAARAVSAAVPAASDVHTTVRSGQVFVSWTEAETPEGTTFNVYVADAPITDVSAARRVGHHIERCSARDWWADPASFDRKATPAPPVGWLLDGGKTRLDPRDGLFVYTARPDDRKLLYFAVTTSDADGHEMTNIVAEANATTMPTAVAHEPIAAYWQLDVPEPAKGAGRGMPLSMKLHGKSGVVANSEYLVFGDETMGWRAGLPFKFAVRIVNGIVIVQPTDRVWINRPHTEAKDGGAPAIWTFWYGYNSHIYDRNAMSTGVPTNYTENRLLWMIDFVVRHYQTDRNRCYLSGSSMGGCGTVSFGLRHPELFAALDARVPIVSYTYDAAASASRLEPSCWTGTITPDVKTNESVPLLERMNGVRLVNAATADLPYLFLVHGRNDGSIPWQNNPAFYRTLDERRQGFSAYWDEGTHPTAGKNAPTDVKGWATKMLRYRLDESFPVFSRTSSDGDPGDGRPQNGDPVGWMNRGFDWRGVVDEAGRYSISISAAYDGATYPIRTDVTLRRLQRFRPAAGETLRVTVDGRPPRDVSVDSMGLVTIPDVILPSAEPVKIVVKK